LLKKNTIKEESEIERRPLQAGKKLFTYPLQGGVVTVKEDVLKK